MSDLTNQRFGRWLALRYAGTRGGRDRWLCLCDCGTEREVMGVNLRTCGSTSCGCQRNESVAEVGRSNRIAGRVTYVAAHMRVRRAKGPASLHACADCGGVGKEWSYDHTDPDEWHEPNRRSGQLMAYSGDLRHYVPRCKSCHVKFDREHSVEAKH